jgi:rifampicin phosphotransferase
MRVHEAMSSIKSLDEITARDGALVGGKALNCARLRQAGLPVPEGFAVPAGAENDPDFPAELDAILQNLPDETLLAVRSSATDEDSAAHSFAGIHTTKLNVTRDGVAAAVHACQESVRSREAISYRQVLGVPTKGLATGVLVQHMVQPISSGVAFTINPVTGAADEFVISASWGLGEAVVGGHVDADEFRIRKRDAAIGLKRIGDKTHRILAENGVSKMVEVEEELRRVPSLTDQQVAELAALIFRIEQIFAVPQDVEWCFDGSKFWIVQARPITAAADRGQSIEIEWTRANVREVLPDLPSPYALGLTCEVLNRAFRAYYRALLAPEAELGSALKPFYGRLYFNLSQFRRICLVSRMPAATLLRSIGHESAIKPEDETVPRPPLKLVARAFPDLLRLSGMMLTMRRRFRRQLRGMQRQSERFEALQADKLSEAQLWDSLSSLDRPAVEQIKTILLLGSVSMLEMRLRAICRRVGFPYEQLAYSHLSAGAKSVSSQQAFDLLQAALQARCEPRARAYFAGETTGFRAYRRELAGTEFLRFFDHFLKEYGHRGLYESDVALPRYVEDPTPLLWAIRTHVLAPDCPTPESIMARQERQATETWNAFRAKVQPPLRLLLIPVTRWLLNRMKQMYLWREQFRSEMVRLFLAVRLRAYLPLAEHLAKRGWIEKPEDFFLLTWIEVGNAISDPNRAPELRTLAARRRAELATWRDIEMPALMKESELPALIRRSTAAVIPTAHLNALSGLCVSPGQAEGEVLVLRDPGEFSRMKLGAVLVAPATDPSWTPLFTLASGLVVELGGVLSHASTVAREYGLPALANVRNATRLLKDGDRVRLDATNGVVYVLDQAASTTTTNRPASTNRMAGPNETRRCEGAQK